MKILHVDLWESGGDRVEFRYFRDNPNEIRSYTRSLSEIGRQTQKADTDYYTRLPEDYAKTGKALYDWLDGSDRVLERELSEHRREGIALAISTSKGLARLPWELLHDGKDFLVAKIPAIVPLRWVRTGSERLLEIADKPADRALNVLFMASSARGVEPELDFEEEEAGILKATRNKPLSLVVEESGCLEELRESVRTRERGYFDIIHLTGHATIEKGVPYFITETEYGDRRDSSATDIAGALPFDLPRLMFLSGCRTGYSEDDEILSMAEELLNLGATAVLGWGKKILDRDASEAAATLYGELVTGGTVLESLSATYRVLREKGARDWHCLRLFVTGEIPGALVKRGRKPLPPPSIVTEFVDPERRLRVASRETFVGRRRELQNCLRVLKNPIENEIGVFIHGMGGNGKSTIAARLCDRLPEHEKIVWWRQVDETALVEKLADKLRDREARIALKDSRDELKYRLRDALERFDRPLLLIFDDFEWNLEYRGDRYLLKPEVAELFKALDRAIEGTNYYHRVIITCRYEFESDLLRSFYLLPSLRSLAKADLQKKLRRLPNFNSDRLDDRYIQRALKLADGNPRLLEWLNDEVLASKDIDSQLSYYENSPEGWRGKVIWRLENEPRLETSETIDKVIAHCLIYELPVPWTALEAVCESIPNNREKLQQAKQRGLIEESIDNREEKLYRASRLPSIHLPREEKELLALCRIAGREVDNLWNNKHNKDEEKWREFFRLSFWDRSNPRRFREGFSKMLAVQYNSESDTALEKELRQQKDCLSMEHLFDELESYLRAKEWRKADEETAWICYRIMVIEGHDNFYALYREISLEYIDKIDALWSHYSEGQFGIKLQAKIYQDLGGTASYDDKIWERFGDTVGWRKGGSWLDYDDVTFNTTANTAHLPVLMYYRYDGSAWGIFGRIMSRDWVRMDWWWDRVGLCLGKFGLVFGEVGGFGGVLSSFASTRLERL